MKPNGRLSLAQHSKALRDVTKKESIPGSMTDSSAYSALFCCCLQEQEDSKRFDSFL